MYFYLIFTIFFTFIFFYNIKVSFEQAPLIQEIWEWKKSDMLGMNKDIRHKLNPLKVLNGYKLNSSELYLFKTNKKVRLEPNILSEIPILGDGFITYKKIGNQVIYLSNYNEPLWIKNYHSYPKPSFTGNIILLLSGDNNQTLIIDLNGNLTGVKQVDGRFLTDYAFSLYSGNVLVCFSGGELYYLNSIGNLIFSTLDNDTKDFEFYKSVSVSPDGNYLSVHYQKKEEDYISVMKSTKEILYTHNLKMIYPHKIFTAVSNEGYLSINTPNKTSILDSKGEILVNLKKDKMEQIHQISFYSGNFFVLSFEDKLLFFNSSGKLIKIKTMNSYPNRILPTGEPDTVFIETPEVITQLKLIL